MNLNYISVTARKIGGLHQNQIGIYNADDYSGIYIWSFSVRIRFEKGFSMVELLTVVAIVGILAKLALSGYSVYKGKAEFSKAASLYTNARTAATAGEEDLGDAFSMAFSESTSSGTPLAGAMVTFFPNITMAKDVILGASVSPCGGATMIEIS